MTKIRYLPQLEDMEISRVNGNSLMREIKEELNINVEIGELIDIIKYDYPAFHLSMDCLWAKIINEDL